MTIYLYKFTYHAQKFEASPPCVAIETYFKLAKIDYKRKIVIAPAQIGLKTLPAINIGGKIISDSENIIRYFEQKTELGLDHFLSADQEATKIMLWRLMNSSIYQFMIAERWLDPAVNPGFIETLKGTPLPSYLSFLLPLLIKVIRYRVRDRYLKSLNHLSQQDREVFMAENFAVLSHILENKRYIFGDKPSSADAYLFAYLYSFLAAPYDNTTKTMIARNYPNLVTYYESNVGELK